MRTLLSLVRRLFLPLLIVAILLALVGTYELGRYSVYNAHPELSGAEQASAILAKVGKLIQLPAEQPTMATINDAASAKKAQPFLANAENGDVLIVFASAQTALLYRPSSNKLIAVGPVTNDVTQQAVQKAAPSTPIETASTTDEASTTKSKK